jgi:subtilase family serine protease
MPELAKHGERARKPAEGKLMRTFLVSALAVTAAAALAASPLTAATAAQGPTGRVIVASTAPAAGLRPGHALSAGSRVRVSVFIGRNQAGLAAAARAISDPASPSYEHYLRPAQVSARFGASRAQQQAVRGWLRHSGLAVTHRDAFVISGLGSAARVESALRVGLFLSHDAGGGAQVVPSRAMSVPAGIAGAVTTIRVAPAIVPLTPHQPLKPAAPPTAKKTAAKYQEQCSSYYGQKKATGLPQAYGRTISWAPCGYLPAQLREAYGAASAGLTGAGVSAAVLSEDNDPTILSDANRWARARHVPQFARDQFATDVEKPAPSGLAETEDAMDVEAVHGMAPAAKLTYVVGNGNITGDPLLDALDLVVTNHLADVVTSSWFVGYMPVAAATIHSWENVLERAAVEGISVNIATGDYGTLFGLQYPSADPWVTGVGGTSLAIGAGGSYLWETGWASHETGLSKNGQSWSPAPPGPFREGGTGGISKKFAEPYYQYGVVTGNKWHGKRMRTVPDVSALGDWNLGYQIGLTVPIGKGKHKYENQVNGGTSLSSPLFTGLEADLVQGRGGISLGFANPALYDYANSAAFHDLTANPQGRGFKEAVIYGPSYNFPPTLSTMGQCYPRGSVACGPGYDLVTGLGSPGPAFFRSFGSKPR